MKTKNASPARNVVLAALFLALAFVLPMVTGHLPQVGNMLCPMHFPILLCGFVLGGPWGLAVGFAAPLLRSVLFGMPPMFPIAISMAFELAAYGAVSGWLYRRVKHTLPMTYATLAAAMVAGRLVWGAVRFVLAGLSGSSFPFSAFLASGAGARLCCHVNDSYFWVYTNCMGFDMKTGLKTLSISNLSMSLGGLLATFICSLWL